MDPFPANAVAVEWEFRCHAKEIPTRAWDWSCRAKDGSVVSKSNVSFRSLREAVADASLNGFSYELPSG